MIVIPKMIVIPSEARDLGSCLRHRNCHCREEPRSLALLGMTTSSLAFGITPTESGGPFLIRSDLRATLRYGRKNSRSRLPPRSDRAPEAAKASEGFAHLAIRICQLSSQPRIARSK